MRNFSCKTRGHWLNVSSVLLFFHFRTKSNEFTKKRDEWIHQPVDAQITDVFSSGKAQLFHANSTKIDATDVQRSWPWYQFHSRYCPLMYWNYEYVSVRIVPLTKIILVWSAFIFRGIWNTQKHVMKNCYCFDSKRIPTDALQLKPILLGILA